MTKQSNSWARRIGGLVDNLVGIFSPERGYYRSAWRDGSNPESIGSTSDGWVAVNQHGAIAHRFTRDSRRAFARDLEDSSDIMESVIVAFERWVVGTGFTLQAKITDANGEDDNEANKLIESLWAEWCLHRNCDIQGRQCFDEMCRMAVRRLRVDGGIFFIKCYTNGGQVPFCLQMREVDELDTTISGLQLDNGNYMVDGIETDQYGKHMAYHFRRYAPDGFSTLESEIMPADRVIYLQKFKRTTDPRELTPFSPSIQRIRHAGGYIENVTLQSRLISRFIAVIKKVLPGGLGFGRGGRAATPDPETGLDRQAIPEGSFVYVQPNEDVTAVQPPQLGSSPSDLTAINQRLIGASQGLSYEATSRDLNRGNYSSIRGGTIEDNATYAIDQAYLTKHLLHEVYTEWLISLALVAKAPFTITELFKNKVRYMAHRFIGVGRPWIDPMKEATANAKALETGQTTLAQIYAEQGKDYREEIAQRKYEIELCKDAGIIPSSPTSSSGGGNNAAATGA
ncbi:MAG: phage portal protein [Armatimonadota bacterium]|nr:phage portal protein [bacterium]